MKQKTDWQLVLEYYRGANEPIGELMINRHYTYLFFKARIVNNKERYINDAIQDVAERLINYVVSIRSKKLRVKKENVKGPLAMRVVNRLKDIARKLKNTDLKVDDKTTFFQNVADQIDIEKMIEDKDLLDCIKSKLGKEEKEFLTLMQELPGKIKEIAAILKTTEKEVRVRKQRVMRHIKKIIVLRLCS